MVEGGGGFHMKGEEGLGEETSVRMGNRQFSYITTFYTKCSDL